MQIRADKSRGILILLRCYYNADGVNSSEICASTAPDLARLFTLRRGKIIFRSLVISTGTKCEKAKEEEME